jgi:hypothetical protein
MTTMQNLNISVSNVRPSTISGCEAGLDMDVLVGDHEMEATLLPDPARDGDYAVWGSPDNWLSDPSRYSREQLREIAEVCEEAAAAWEPADA